jgi:quercetin dioxygenase-like cupin family protein
MPVVPAGTLAFAQLPGRLSADPLAAGPTAGTTAGPTDGPTAGPGLGCSVRVVRIAPGPRTPHVHPHSAEICYVVEGTGTAWEDDVATPVGAGDLLVVPPGVPHATVASGTSDLVLVCFFPHPDLTGNIQELPGPERTAG